VAAEWHTAWRWRRRIDLQPDVLQVRPRKRSPISIVLPPWAPTARSTPVPVSRELRRRVLAPVLPRRRTRSAGCFEASDKPSLNLRLRRRDASHGDERLQCAENAAEQIGGRLEAFSTRNFTALFAVRVSPALTHALLASILFC